MSITTDPAEGQHKRSVLEDHLDVVGTLHDKEVAEMLGMTAGGVRAYRQRHNIPAGWRADASAPPPRRRAPAPKRTRPAPRAARRVVPPPPKPSVPSRGRRRSGRKARGPLRSAFTVLARSQGELLSAVTLATSPLEAAALTLKHFQAGDPRASVVDVTLLGTVL